MQLSQDQAYLAMYAFLAKQFSPGCQELGGIFSSMSLLPDGAPMDSAMGADWKETVVAASRERYARIST